MKKVAYYCCLSLVLISCSVNYSAYAKNDCLSQKKEQALNGDSEAAIQVGWAYYKGESCVEKSIGNALVWIRKSALLGNKRAQYSLGVMYLHGLDVNKDILIAAEYLEMAANQGDTAAMEYLRVMYANGKGIKKDYKRSYYWLYVEHQGDLPAWSNEATWKQRLTQAEITEVEESAEKKIRQLFSQKINGVRYFLQNSCQAAGLK